MPISRRTLEALKIANLINPTDIQAAAIPHALAGRDILGAAKTGSGKTLGNSFLTKVICCDVVLDSFCDSCHREIVRRALEC